MSKRKWASSKLSDGVTVDRIPILNVYYLLCYAWGRVQDRNTARLGQLEGSATVEDLLGKMLAVGVNQVFRRGVDRAYLERREDLAGVRGKLSVGETVKRMLQAQGRAACDFEELSVDIPANRILRSSLRRLLRGGALHRDVRAEVRAAYRRFDGVSLIRLHRGVFSRLQLGGNRRLYRFLLSVCKLLHESSMVDERTGRATFRDFRRDEATMWAIFEEFVAGFYEREQRVYRVNPEGRRRVDWADWYAEDAGSRARIPVMTADVILESSQRRIILDTKYYAETLAHRSATGSGKLHSGNLYQLLAYLRNRQANRPEGSKHEGILLYPKVDETLRVDVRLEGFRVQARTVDLEQDWRSIHEEMLETIGLSPA